MEGERPPRHGQITVENGIEPVRLPEQEIDAFLRLGVPGRCARAIWAAPLDAAGGFLIPRAMDPVRSGAQGIELEVLPCP
ncbi:MAG: hypothetical protein MZU95_10005 [Desulfomicrobium escambiense]|nr:hypothetical protein [Desulfomicrobium escambiense]